MKMAHIHEKNLLENSHFIRCYHHFNQKSGRKTLAFGEPQIRGYFWHSSVFDLSPRREAALHCLAAYACLIFFSSHLAARWPRERFEPWSCLQLQGSKRSRGHRAARWEEKKIKHANFLGHGQTMPRFINFLSVFKEGNWSKHAAIWHFVLDRSRPYQRIFWVFWVRWQELVQY